MTQTEQEEYDGLEAENKQLREALGLAHRCLTLVGDDVLDFEIPKTSKIYFDYIANHPDLDF